MEKLIDKLEKENVLSQKEYEELLWHRTPQTAAYLFERAVAVRQAIYGRDVYIRGLIEFTNYCKNDCYYCGIRRSNKRAERYRLSKEEILSCCENGYNLGFRTFVLQGGEDTYYNRERMVALIQNIKKEYPECALTLSIGEKSKEEYQAFFDAGADRYLLRHETADSIHYQTLHPRELTLENRKRCLRDLKEIGFQTGCGFMVGSPSQTVEHLTEDLCFLQKFQPQMVGIGPFIPHKETPFSNEAAGSAELTLFLLGIVRLMLPKVLLPATTALGTLRLDGRECGILSGANVVMPNLSPIGVRKKYLLYNDKICTEEEAAEGCETLKEQMKRIGYRVVTDRGDYKV